MARVALVLLALAATTAVTAASTYDDSMIQVKCQAYGSTTPTDCSSVSHPRWVRYQGNLSPSHNHAIQADTGPPALVIEADVFLASELPPSGAKLDITLTYGECAQDEYATYDFGFETLTCAAEPDVFELFTFDNNDMSGLGAMTRSTSCWLFYDDRNGDNYLTIDTDCLPDLATQIALPSDMTVSMWVKFPSNILYFLYTTRLFRFRNGNQIVKFEVASNNIPHLYISDATGATIGDLSAPSSWDGIFSTISTNKWNHFQVSFGASGMYIYCNGILIASSPAAVNVGSLATGTEFKLGSGYTVCDGLGIDNVAVLSGQLTPRQLMHRLPIRGCVGFSCAVDFQTNLGLRTLSYPFRY
ncbi:hypothetical protein PTSG_09822 [Salpingoeca rosetta]|uniref:LamG-like jellyroll fold domain-containing protein n=1 Tax=Salpingoeca rosetta (strain ATCC 50818 / BSB-021) TaxID=946362 RepID=F2UP55_SALR5|nr:uncharacterized protein PTSG_09822 [Salpingoeca rosetta]EGD79410.1 hypothetical protein PTSG_09822 [Salpingoeca rosetta]|eukprot:XP_004989179.1 hypothetical protein PTSG_09822 [Salpingoeca rosetta]